MAQALANTGELGYSYRPQTSHLESLQVNTREPDVNSKVKLNPNKQIKKKNSRPKKPKRKNASQEASYHNQALLVQGAPPNPVESGAQNQRNNQGFYPIKHCHQAQTHDALSTNKPNTPLPPVISMDKKIQMHQNMVEKLKKKSAKHPQAQFVCKLCSYYCDTVTVVDKHISDRRHSQALEEHMRKCTINQLPGPTPDQLAQLNEIVLNQVQLHGMSTDDQQQRQDIATRVKSIVMKVLPGCDIRLYGSSLSGFGTKSSDVNIDFVVPSDKSPSKLLLELSNALSLEANWEDVNCDLNADLPGIHFKDKYTNLKCLICLSSKNAYGISRLLAQYEALDKRVKILATVFRTWASICNLNKVDRGTWPSYAFDLLLVYFLQQTEDPVLPVLHELVENPNPNSVGEDYVDAVDVADKWHTRNKKSPGELWLNLLAFYSRDFSNSERVVCIRQLEPLKRSVKKWPGRKIAIEDPFTPKRNVSRSIVNIISFDYILYCFCTTFKYFATLQTKYGPIFGYIQMPCCDPELEESSKMWYDNPSVDDILQSAFCYSTKNNSPSSRRNNKDLVISRNNALRLIKHFNSKHLHYEFSKSFFTNNKLLPVVCCICQQEGHTKDLCKEEKLPPLPVLPPMTQEFLNNISLLCEQTFESLLPSKEETKQREDIVQALQEYLSKFNPQARLELFGSSRNGFGLLKSDLDICLTFKDSPNGELRKGCNIFEDLFTWLRKNDKLENVIAITTAKVPIIKFLHIDSRLEGDISVYNTLAQRNTKMLRAYSEIDRRVKIVGFMFKRFAKLCDICDASRGSLSSYAYTLMVIYFLQRCDPPIVPVLQELCGPNEPRKKIVVDGCDTYFFDDLEKLKYIWPGYNKNTLSVGQLWLQLLCFYTEEFDFKTNVIAIRQLETLRRFEKLWNSKSIAIEDPFDLGHNLGAGLSRKMHIFIVNALRRGRRLFGSPVPLDRDHLQSYFFDASQLVDGSPPRDRCCRFCNKIGHVLKDCPVKKQESNKMENEVFVNRKGSHLNHRVQSEHPVRGMYHPDRIYSRKEPPHGQRVPNAFPARQRSYSQRFTSPLDQLPGLRAQGYGNRSHTEPSTQFNSTLSYAASWKSSNEMHQQKLQPKFPEPFVSQRNVNRSYRSEHERSRGTPLNDSDPRYSPRRMNDAQSYHFSSQSVHKGTQLPDAPK